MQPNSQMIYKHLARVRLTKWVLEIQEIRLINDVIVVFFVAMLKEFLSQETQTAKSQNHRYLYATKEKIFHLLICWTSTVLVSVSTSLVASHV